MNGIDVSQWQGMIDFAAVKDAGIDLVYLKASEGTQMMDPFFYRNYVNAKTAGLPVGFYHYLTAKTEDGARAEAYHFLKTTEGLVNEAKLVMDLEDIAGLSRAKVNEIAGTFLGAVEEYSGKDPAIYTGVDTARLLDGRFAAYPLWIAQYDVEEPDMENVWETWAGWQYTDRGRVAGVQGWVDRDIFREEILEERQTAGKMRGVPASVGKSSMEYHIYRVRRGDTLDEIARRFGVSVGALKSFNKIGNGSLIYPGQLLKLPVFFD